MGNLIETPAEKRLHFTDARLKAIEPPAAKHIDYSDETQPGLIFRVTATGKRVFSVYKWSKIYGPVRRRLGAFGAGGLAVADARRIAREVIVQIEQGKNPNHDDRAKREMIQTDTWRDLWSRYQQEQHPECRPSTVRNDVSMWERHICGRDKKSQKRDEVPAPLPVGLSLTKCRAFTLEQARSLHGKITEASGATIADEVITLMSRLYRHSGIESNPFKKHAKGKGGIKLNGKKRIVRYLTAEHFKKLVHALNVDSDQEVADLVRVALFTGQRRDNVRTMMWSEIDLHVKVWRIPAEKFKTKKEAETPIPTAALQVLQRRRDDQQRAGLASPYVFPSRLDTQRPRQVMRRQVVRIFKRAGLEGWRFHDLRHACASAILLAGGTLAQAGRQLNHANSASTERYAHLHAESVAQAADRGFDALAENCGPRRKTVDNRGQKRPITPRK